MGSGVSTAENLSAVVKAASPDDLRQGFDFLSLEQQQKLWDGLKKIENSDDLLETTAAASQKVEHALPARKTLDASASKSSTGGRSSLSHSRSRSGKQDTTCTDSEDGATDPFDLERFCKISQTEFDQALREIANGRKSSHWSWYFFPVAPYVVGGIERGSSQNKQWCLRDTPTGKVGDKAARAFLRTTSHGANLRNRYIAMMTDVARQLEKGITPLALVGSLDVPKLASSLRLFERVSRDGFDDDVNILCCKALKLMKENTDP